jgi:hypothetical protein
MDTIDTNKLFINLNKAYGNNHYRLLYTNQATFDKLKGMLGIPLDVNRWLYNSADVKVDDSLADGEFRFEG